MKTCDCKDPHERRRVVLTGGPGAGKTAVLELIRQSFCVHVRVLPESAGIVFGGGFPRNDEVGVRRAAQRAIFFVQRELEATAEASNAAIALCDRGTVDGAAYWPGPGDLWTSVGTAIEEQLLRYDAIIHLRTPPPEHGYNRDNPLRVESPAEAAAVTSVLPMRGPLTLGGSLSTRLPTSSRRRAARWQSCASCCPSAAATTSYAPWTCLRRGSRRRSGSNRVEDWIGL